MSINRLIGAVMTLHNEAVDGEAEWSDENLRIRLAPIVADMRRPKPQPRASGREAPTCPRCGQGYKPHTGQCGCLK